MSSNLAMESGPVIFNSRRMVIRLLLIGIVLLGFGLRLYDLEGQSMWSDEGLSLYRSGLPISKLLANVITVDGVETQDTNPPFYFLLLHLSRSLIGDTIFALRSVGVASAILAIPLIYSLGQISFGRRVGLVAALLLAISPFHVWQSQVLRNYGLLISINLLSIYGLLRYIVAVPSMRTSKWLLLWIGAGLLGIYTHYYGFFIFAFGLVAFTISFLQQRRIRHPLKKWHYWAAIVLASLILLPAIVVSYGRFAAGQQIDFQRVPLVKVLNHAASAFTVGVNWSLVLPWWRVVPVVLIALLGLWLGWRRRPKATLLVLGYQVIPLSLLLLVSLINPLYNGVRHLLIGLPPFLTFLATGLVGLYKLAFKNNNDTRSLSVWKGISLALGLLVLVNQASWLDEQFTSPQLVRDDIRGAAVYLNQHAIPNDVIVLHDSLIKFTFDYYYEGAAPVVTMPEYGQYEVIPVIEDLMEVVEGKDRVWFLSKPTPRNGFDIEVLPEWLNNNLLHRTAITFSAMWLRVQLDAYDPPATASEIPDSGTKVDLVWDEALRLMAYQIPHDIQSGSMFISDFYLSQPTDTQVQYTLSLWLVDEHGNTMPPIQQPIPQGYPPAWIVADTVTRYRHRILLPAGIPPGSYALWMRLINTADGQLMATTNGDIDIYLSDVNVKSASCEASPAAMPINTVKPTKFGEDIALQGYSLPTGEMRPGHEINIDLLWCARNRPQTNYRWRLQLVDGSNQLITETVGPVDSPGYPLESWQPDELIMGQASLVVPATLDSGTYNVKLSILPPESENAVPIGWLLGGRQLNLGKVMVGAWPMETELPPISRPLAAQFGQPPIIEFHGYDISKDQPSPGDELDLSLVWRSLSEDIPLSYKVFVHLIAVDNDLPIAQADARPVGGFRPTTSWRNGEVIVDSHQLQIPSNVEAGPYQLWIGFYDAETGARLPVIRAGAEGVADRLFLQEIQIVE